MERIDFNWDPAKATLNRRKHGISFEEAQTAFFDDRALIIDDPRARRERDTVRAPGMSTSLRVLVVVHVLRTAPDRIRIISARKATRSERTTYAKEFNR